MTNYGFEIHLNDKYVCRAGFESAFHVLTVIFTSTKRSNNTEDLAINVGGLDSETKQLPEWINQELKNGDRISIQVVTDKFDAPSRFKEWPKEMALQNKIDYYHKLKEELKDHLKE